MHFDHLVVRPQSKDLDQLKNYRYVCAKALQKIENNEKVADHVWYRLELAKVIYIIGFEEFKKEVEPYLYDWSALAWIKGASCQKKFFIYHDKRLNLNSQEGHSVYFYNFLTLLQNGSHLSRIFDLRITSASLVKSSFWNKNDYSKCLLESPQNGVLFFDDRYYGLLDYDLQKAFLYDFIDNNKKMDFSDQVPWNVIKRYPSLYSHVGLKGNSIGLCWLTIDQRLEGSLYYKINKNLDLSSKKSYKKFTYWANNPDYELLQKYSHAWFSWYAFELLCRRPILKFFWGLLPKYKFLYRSIAAFMAGVLCGFLFFGTMVIFILCLKYIFVFKVTLSLSLFSSLLTASFVARGGFRYMDHI